MPFAYPYCSSEFNSIPYCRGREELRRSIPLKAGLNEDFKNCCNLY